MDYVLVTVLLAAFVSMDLAMVGFINMTKL